MIRALVLSIVMLSITPASAEWKRVEIKDRLTGKSSFRFELLGSGDFPTRMRIECDAPIIESDRARPIAYLDFLRSVGVYEVYSRHVFDKSEPETRRTRLFSGGRIMRLADYHANNTPIEFIERMKKSKTFRIEVQFENDTTAIFNFNLKGSAEVIAQLPCSNR